MLWYVLQTRTGGEEKLMEMIRKIVPKRLYGECFVVYHEQLWRRKQQTFVHVKRAFPGYVFITSEEPEALFFCLKEIPAMIKMMTDEESFFLSLEPEEAAFLEQLMDERYVIGLSYLETDGNGNIYQVSGPLASCIPRIVRCKYGKRYVIVRLQIHGKDKDILLGIILKEDICREVQYGKVEAPICVPKQYQLDTVKTVTMKTRTAEEKRKGCGQAEEWSESLSEELSKFSVGDFVLVADGVFRGMSGMVYQVSDKKKLVKIGIRFLGRNIEIEVVPEILKKGKKVNYG